MRLSRRQWLGAAAVLAAAPPFKLMAQNGASITPERFGAVGDGVTNDTDAFAKMARFINHKGGGQVVLRRTTYVVGQQSTPRNSSTDPYAFEPADILNFIGCTKSIAIYGNGARLKAADGLCFGTFDPVTGEPTQHPMPYIGYGEWSAPYIAMIMFQNCTGDIYVEDLELDGNLPGLKIGGPYGDGGWQLPGDGLRLSNNVGAEKIVRVRTHHHARDGILIDGAPDRQSASILQDVTSEYNVRQGCSLVSGRNYSFVNSAFNHTGRAGLMSPPGAGFDIEAETTPIRNLNFSGCEFSNNSGAGLVADSGDTEGATFDSCRFIGTTGWSVWANKPAFRFTNCTFVGAVVHPFSDPDPARATQFSNCSFLDDPALSPTGKVFGPSQPIVNMAVSENVLFDGCRFDLTSNLVLPWSWKAHYNNCTMSQVAPDLAHPKGTYTGTCTIIGNIELYGTIILGDLTVNGQLMPRTVQA